MRTTFHVFRSSSSRKSPPGRTNYQRQFPPRELVSTLKGLLNYALSSGTHKLYQRAWATFTAFTQQFYHSDNLELPISIPSFALFISYLHARKLASSTIKSYLSAISYVHKLKGLRDPTQAFLINKLLTALSRQGSCDIRLTISRPVLHELVGSQGHTTSSACQRTLYSAMFLLAFTASLGSVS